jgi:hypothetical protein
MTNTAAGTLSASCSLGLQSAGGMNRHVWQAIFKMHILRKLNTFNFADI